MVRLRTGWEGLREATRCPKPRGLCLEWREVTWLDGRARCCWKCHKWCCKWNWQETHKKLRLSLYLHLSLPSPLLLQESLKSKLTIHLSSGFTPSFLLIRLFLSHLVSLTNTSSPIFKGKEKKRGLSLALLPPKLAFPCSIFLNQILKQYIHALQIFFLFSTFFNIHQSAFWSHNFTEISLTARCFASLSKPLVSTALVTV